MGHTAAFWIGFHLLILLLWVIDLCFVNRKQQIVDFKKACIMSGFWIFVALLFNLFIYFQMGPDSALQFFTGYLIEKSLSVDNLFLFLLTFSQLQIPAAYQYKVLFWGILGALVFRISLILAGVAMIEQFHWMFYIFGAFLIVSGLAFLLQRFKSWNFSAEFLFKKLGNIITVANDDQGGNFFVRHRGKWKATALFLALLKIECEDIIMALDSIPTVFAVTTDPFLIYTSNVFAILGLRSLYFVLVNSLKKLRYFKMGLAAILIFVGFKMLTREMMSISLPVSLGIIVAILGVTIAASLRPKKV